MMSPQLKALESAYDESPTTFTVSPQVSSELSELSRRFEALNVSISRLLSPPRQTSSPTPLGTLLPPFALSLAEGR